MPHAYEKLNEGLQPQIKEYSHLLLAFEGGGGGGGEEEEE